MGQAEFIVRMVQRKLLPQAVRDLTCRSDSTPHGGHMLPDGEVEPFHKARDTLTTQGGQHVLDSRQCAEDHPMAHLREAQPLHGFDDLRLE